MKHLTAGLCLLFAFSALGAGNTLTPEQMADKLIRIGIARGVLKKGDKALERKRAEMVELGVKLKREHPAQYRCAAACVQNVSTDEAFKKCSAKCEKIR